jgi:pimeloyl-ACP methyl ester carboxylesterase
LFSSLKSAATPSAFCARSGQSSDSCSVAQRLPSFDRPTLVVWASQDRVMPPEHGRRLADLLPHGRLVEVDDSYTLIPLDQPAMLAQVIADFTHARR